ncbi:MAG: CPBP family glutamic-type intramembrane protease, partial [Candidatus Lokiarchaeota archaeon]
MSEIKYKYLIIIICVIICIIPLYFGVFIDLMFFNQFNVLIVSVIIIGTLLLFFLGIIIDKYAYNEETLKIMGEHGLISALIKKDNNWVIFFIFPLTMVMEEFIFRYYSIGTLHFIINLGTLESIIISSIIFALYHLHFWFKLKNQRITIIYI